MIRSIVRQNATEKKLVYNKKKTDCHCGFGVRGERAGLQGDECVIV